MTNETTSGMNVGSPVNVGPTKQVDYKNLKSGEDFRSQANDVTMPAQPAPRAVNDNDEGVGV